MPPTSTLRYAVPRAFCSPALTGGARIARTSALLLLPPSPSAPSTAPTPTRSYATAAAAVPGGRLSIPPDYIPPTAPPTARPADTRKSQLLRTYTSLLRSTPLILIFQHNNLTAVEWAAVRRELRLALADVSPEDPLAPEISKRAALQVIRTRMFDVALKIVEFYDPSKVPPSEATTLTGKRVKVVYNHDLSKAAYRTVKAISTGEKPVPENSVYAQIQPLLVGPLAIFTLPVVSPAHLSAALSVLAPNPPAFPPPSKKKSPGYYDPIVQSGLSKLLLVGGRLEDRVFDQAGIEWVGGIKGGVDSLRAQLVHLLQSAGLGLTSTLEGASKSLWLTLESRRSVLEEEQKGGEKSS
jgi:large subunit ribosomal protein L10